MFSDIDASARVSLAQDHKDVVIFWFAAVDVSDRIVIGVMKGTYSTGRFSGVEAIGGCGGGSMVAMLLLVRWREREGSRRTGVSSG